MKILTHTEGFELTDSIRNFTENYAREVQSSIPGEIRLEAFLKQDGQKNFTCTLKARLWRRHWVVKESGPDLYTLIAETHKILSRNLHKAKEKRKALLHKRALRDREHFFSENSARLLRSS